MSDHGDRPGTTQLRHAIVALPIGVLCLLIGLAIESSSGSDGLGAGIAVALLLVGVVATAFGVYRLAQGLYQRVG